MQKILLISEIVVGMLMALVILMQQRGTSLGGAFGGEGSVYRARRGIEKVLFYITIVLAILFIGLAITTFIIS
jgi:preprotein translocase subunit SecG